MSNLNVRLHANNWQQQLDAVCSMVRARFRGTATSFARKWRQFSRWISQPHIRKLISIVAAAVVFAAIFFGIPALGFGAAGIVGGSLAAAYQSVVYGAYTVGGSLFALLQSIGMITGAVTLLATAGAAIAGAFTWVITGLFGWGRVK